MVKKFLMPCFCFLCCLSNLYGGSLAAKITAKTAGADCIVMSISQEKHISIMDGALRGEIVLAADKSGNVRWQTLSPFSSISILKGEKTFNFENIDGKWVAVKSRLDSKIKDAFETVTRIVMSDFSKPIEGFKMEEFENRIELTPVSKALPKAVSKITVFVDLKLERASEIRMDSPDGDYVVLKIKKVSINPPDINDAFDLSNLDKFQAERKAE